MKSLDDLYQEAYDYLLNEEEIIGFYSAPEIVESWNNIYDFIASIGYVISSQIIFVRRHYSQKHFSESGSLGTNPVWCKVLNWF